MAKLYSLELVVYIYFPRVFYAVCYFFFNLIICLTCIRHVFNKPNGSNNRFLKCIDLLRSIIFLIRRF